MILRTEDGLTPARKKQADLTARSILKAYGKNKAMRRAEEISSGMGRLSEDNRLFCEMVSRLVREGVDHGTVNGKTILWR